MKKHKKIISLIVIISFFYTFLSATTFSQIHATESIENVYPNDNDTNSNMLKDAKLLDKKDVMKVIDTNIQNYLRTDIQTEGKNIIASKDFVPLYDFEDSLFAYMVPLLENGKEIGYITVGAIEDGYATYEIFIEDDVVNNILSKMKQKEQTLQTESPMSSQLVFLPPFQYIIKVTAGNTEKYFDISNPLHRDQDISDMINKNKNDLQKYYQRIRTTENKKHIQKIIENTQSNADGSNFSLAVTAEDVRLQRESWGWGGFVPVIIDEGVYSYGGDQGWWKKIDNEKYNRGCGPVAAANITNYLAEANPSMYGRLYSPASMSQNDFLRHMDALYDAIKPGLIGEVFVMHFKDAVENYARNKNVTLSGVISDAAFTLDNTANYIKDGLRANSPVATLNTKKFSDYQYEWHWMTITKYFRDTSDNRWIAVSTWGERRGIDYRVHFDAMKWGWVEGGLMYFK